MKLLATIYGFSVAQMYSMIPKHLKFGGVLASGGGSSQYTMFSDGLMHSSLNIEIKLKTMGLKKNEIAWYITRAKFRRMGVKESA